MYCTSKFISSVTMARDAMIDKVVLFDESVLHVIKHFVTSVSLNSQPD